MLHTLNTTHFRLLLIPTYMLLIHILHSLIGTSPKMSQCYSSLPSPSVSWGCGSAPPTGLELHSGWLSGSLLFTVLLVTRSIAMCFPLYPLPHSMLVSRSNVSTCYLCVMCHYKTKLQTLLMCIKISVVI